MNATILRPDPLVQLEVVRRDPERWADSDVLFWASVARAMKDLGYDTQPDADGYRSSLIIPARFDHWQHPLPGRMPTWVSLSSEAQHATLVHPRKRSTYATLTLLPVR